MTNGMVQSPAARIALVTLAVLLVGFSAAPFAAAAPQYDVGAVTTDDFERAPVAQQPRQESGLSVAQSVNSAARDHVRYAIDLAGRGAVCSARAELIEALSSVAFALDAGQPTPIHGSALAAGLKAISEADDFAPQGLRADRQVNLELVIATHKTPVLKNVDTSRVTQIDALQSYYEFAADRLALAGRHEEAASMALYGWGRLEIAFPAVAGTGNSLGVPRAIALQRAAIAVDPGNYLAANELAVHLARCGQWDEAKQLLLHSVSVVPTAEAWYNLSLAQRNLGQQKEAQWAHQQYLALAANQQASALEPGGTGKSPMMRWVDSAVFVRDSGPDPLGSLAGSPERPAKAPSASSSPQSSKDPLSHLSSWLKTKLGDDPSTATQPDQHNSAASNPAIR